MARSVRQIRIPDVDIDHDPRVPAWAEAVCEQQIVRLDVGDERSEFWPIRLLYKHANGCCKASKKNPPSNVIGGRIKISSKRFGRDLD
ncbi:MAG: hypothetical protein ABJQ34_18095 [Paracoccaceae bacterium]